LARRDIKGVVDFAYLESFAAGDDDVIDEVLALFREQSAIWGAMLRPEHEGWRDAVHTLKGAARGVGANRLGDVCQECEAVGPGGLPAVHTALDAALSDIAAYAHERALNSLKTPRPGAATGRPG
jgi:HPt (histidine-containing phosphotransfer) domain-containing protein